MRKPGANKRPSPGSGGCCDGLCRAQGLGFGLQQGLDDAPAGGDLRISGGRGGGRLGSSDGFLLGGKEKVMSKLTRVM
jgi:hypothetical protein